MYNGLIEVSWMNQKIDAQMHNALDNKKEEEFECTQKKDAQMYNAQDDKRRMYTNVDARMYNLPIDKGWKHNETDAQI